MGTKMNLCMVSYLAYTAFIVASKIISLQPIDIAKFELIFVTVHLPFVILEPI